MDQDVKDIVKECAIRRGEVLEKGKVRPTIGAKGHQLSVDAGIIREIHQGGRDVVEPCGRPGLIRRRNAHLDGVDKTAPAWKPGIVWNRRKVSASLAQARLKR